jgi:hypothetical protein
MIDLELDAFGEYLSADTDAWLDDVSDVDDELTTSLVDYLESTDARYADTESVTGWLRTLGDVSGIYGDNGPVSVATCNEDTYLADDVSFVFAHAGEGTYIVETGRGYFAHTPAYAVVRSFTGYDDAEAFSYSQGHLGHVETTDCPADLILEAGHRVWRNGGGGDDIRFDDMIRRTDPDDATTAHIVCPDCGGRMAAAIY